MPSSGSQRLDAASLDNLLPGDVVVPRRLLEVNGRILGTVGWQEPGLEDEVHVQHKKKQHIDTDIHRKRMESLPVGIAFRE